MNTFIIIDTAQNVWNVTNILIQIFCAIKNMHIHIVVILLPESKSFRLLVNPSYANNALEKEKRGLFTRLEIVMILGPV